MFLAINSSKIFTLINSFYINYVIIIIATCYKLVKNETQQMQRKIEKELGLNPVDQDVIVLYDGEKEQQVKLL